ncbi:hypothetical protein LTS18_007634 [Coniosporium uncinatum]|uniref:Uncharacterized protein n=1 Tax=Coniosporium uncinatum TaxID=93489 RepID=A0ACC3DP93_9PEZI|nr:hypothetical protein LTS18_007634 [Coniosporium uncinatum]
MLFHTPLVAATAATCAARTNLYVASYSGNVTSLSLTNARLDFSSTTNFCGPSPSWLTWDSFNRLLYCTDEGLNQPEGSVSSFKAAVDGGLAGLGRQTTIPGPVSAVKFGSSFYRGLAVAH